MTGLSSVEGDEVSFVATGTGGALVARRAAGRGGEAPAPYPFYAGR